MISGFVKLVWAFVWGLLMVIPTIGGCTIGMLQSVGADTDRERYGAKCLQGKSLQLGYDPPGVEPWGIAQEPADSSFYCEEARRLSDRNEDETDG